MPMPYYVSPEQLMKDKADYARKGIARGKSVIAIEYSDGILFIAENPSATLHKISEIYDRIAFAGVGKFNEFEQLRIGGIRLVDVKGYSYSPGRCDGEEPRQCVLADPGQHLHRRAETLRVRDPRGGRR